MDFIRMIKIGKECEAFDYKMQHLSLIRLARLFLFFFPFFSLLSSIFLALISRIKSKNT